MLFRIPSANFSQEEVENSLPFSIPQVEQLRNVFVENTKLLLPDPYHGAENSIYAGLLLGMVIGSKDLIPYNFNQRLKNTGVVHVVVVSGQNLSLLAGFLLGFSTLLGRKKTIWASFVLISLYVFLTGFQIPVMRAAIMFFFTTIAKLFGREGDDIQVLMSTALILLIINPVWILSISFQLSFLATLGVVIVAPLLTKRAWFMPDVLKQDICVTVAAQLMTAPLIAFYFNQFSVAGLVVNVLVLWTIPFIMIFGAFALILSTVNFFLASIVLILPKVLLYYFVAVVNLFSQPWANTYIHNFSGLQLVGGYLLISACLLLIKKSIPKAEKM